MAAQGAVDGVTSKHSDPVHIGGGFSLGFRCEQPPVPDVELKETEKVVPVSFPLDKITETPGLISGGEIPLNKVSRYLGTDIPDEATAELLWAPENLADMDGKGLGTWNDSFDRVCDVKNYNNLGSLQSFPFSKQDSMYERLVANAIKIAFRKASMYMQDVKTGLFIPTDSLLCGREPGSDAEVIKNNLYATQDDVAQQGKPLITEEFGLTNWFLSASQDTKGYARAVNLERSPASKGEKSHFVPKGHLEVSTRLAVLMVHPL